MKTWNRIISFMLALSMVLGMVPYTAPHVHGSALEPEQENATMAEKIDLVPLYQEIPVKPGQLVADTVEIIESEIYGYVVGYELKKGHTLSISDTNYVFSVRKLADGNYSTMLKQATTASFTATEDMTVGMLIRKPDKSALTAEELANIVIYDSQYGMIGVAGSAHRFTVEAETIDGGTHTTRAAIFLPDSYTESGEPTRLIVMTNGQNGHLRDNQWNANTADDVALMRHYMDADYAVLVVDNTAGQTSNTSDLGCPQLVDSYFKAYEYVRDNLNVEELFSLHSRSNGTFAAIRIMRERPELVKCALMTGAQFSMKTKFSMNPSFIADRFGFEDATGATFEADKLIGYDAYTDVDGMEYSLPPTFWMLAQSDATTTALTTIDKIEAHGNDVTTATYTDTDHSGVCRLNTQQSWADALAYLNAHQTSDAEHRYCAWTVTKEATCAEAGEMRRECADCDRYETMELAQSGHVSKENEEICSFCGEVLLDPLYQEIPVMAGQFNDSNGTWVASDIYGCVIGYELRKGHTLSISDTNYVFSVRQLIGGSYNTMVKEATTASFTATEDMTVSIRVRKPDKSALTAEELASVVLYDTQYGMLGVEGYSQQFYVDAQTIDGGTAATRANIFLPASYTENGEPTRLIVMTNGHSAYLKDNVWNGNTADNVGIIRNYLDAGYAVWVVNNTADSTSRTTDIGCPQLVSSYLEAYEYIQEHFNVEERFSIHSRSFGTFSAMRIMLEAPELVKCAVMTGPRVSIKLAWTANKAFVADRFGFDDTTGATYEADKMVGHDPYTDVDGDSYALPPTFWMMASGDATAEPVEVIEKLTAHGNDVTSATYAGIDHTGICTLNTDETFADALAFLNGHQEPETLEGKTISILGDSISTFSGVSNNTAYNSTIGSNAVYYSGSNLGISQADTWWRQTIDALGMELLVNNSWSGSCILHKRSNTVGAYADRCVQLHNDHTGQEPDIIAVFMGTNDFSYYQSALGTANIDYDTLITDNGDGTFTCAEPTTSCEAYAIMLHKMVNRYPDAEIYCMTLTARRDPDKEDNYADVGQPTAFNESLTAIAERFGCTVVDLENCGIDKEAEVFDTYMGDGRVHPNAEGMDLITQALVSAMLGKETKVYDISIDLTGVTSDNDASVILGEEAYTAVLTGKGDTADMDVSVTMGGVDVTETVYSGGKITIQSVTGDITVTAVDNTPASYRWEFDGEALVSVSGDNCSENALTLQGGSVSNGILTNAYYLMDEKVVLRHDRPWTVEFKASGSWSGMLFSAQKSAGTAGNTYLFKTTGTNGFMGFGERVNSQYQNYGIALGSQGVDTTLEHTYRLENRIASDGSNMVYLLVDGTDYGAMNHYFIGGSTDQGTTVDWLSGKDLTFSYIGASGHAMNNCAIDYIAVWEGGIPEVQWEQGTIAAATGLNRGDTTRLRTVDHLKLSDYGAVGINFGYTMTAFAYDADKTFLGTTSWLGSGLALYTDDLLEKYPSAVYFRVALRELDSDVITVDNILAAGVTFYAPGEEIPVKESNLKYEDIGSIGSWQDGAVYNGKLFVLNSSGTGAVYDLGSLTKLGSLTLDNKDVLKPHANSVCFGNTYYAEGDKYPLLYVNIYNNYASATDRMEGTCCVYRLTETDGIFSTELVQVIEIGFTEDLTLWKSKESNGDVRPYGNFVVDTDNDKLYAFVMRDAEKTTRFFRFDLPALSAGIYNEAYGCNVVTLESADIEAQFDTEYFNYLQGCCYYGGKIISAEGFNSGGSAEPALRIVDLKSGTVEKTYYPAEAGLTKEPEVVCVDPSTGKVYYAAADGVLRVLKMPEVSSVLSLRYDDHYDVSGKTVEIVDAGKPTSYKVGYGVAEGTLDDAVVTLDGNSLVATGIGTAKVRIDGTLYEVTVTAAPISLLLLIGQSNMQGSEGNADQSIVCEDGQVYSTYGDRYTMTTSNATNFAPSALTGEGSTLNVNGNTTNLEDWPVYLLNEAGAGKAGPDSGFAYEWVKQTGEKVWVVNAAHGGSSITTWQKTGANYKEAVALFSACQQTLQKEIDAGHFTLSHMGYFWCQGCTDYSRTAEWYVEKYLAMHDNLKTELAFSEDVTFEFGGIIPVRAGHESYTSYRQGVYADTTTAKYHESFKDLRFTGPRVAQYWMANNPDLPDIWNVCNIGEDWVTMPDGTDGVAEYFQAHYPNGTVDYTTQVQQAESWYTPTTPAAVHDSIHYNQIGYNEVGREAVRNALINLGEIEAPDVDTTVEFLTWDGYTQAEEVTAATAGSSGTLVVPKVYPVWKSKEVTYQLSEGLSYEYYDLLADSMQTTGTLTAVGAQTQAVTVNKAEPGSHFEDHLQALPDALCSGVNLWKLLEHDKYYYASGTGWGTHSSGTVYSVTIPIDPGDKIYASSFGAAGTNGSSSSNGIRVTFFSEYGVAKTMAPSEVYPEFTANGGYLVAPEGAVAVNIPMWSDSDEWEIYILNWEHDQSSEICSICGKDSHTHAWSDWQTVTAPSIDGPGEEMRTCACGETETRDVEGVWQTMELSEHMNTMPESYCTNTNLWPLLEHDEEFFSPGTQWHVHSSGNVYSVTIPLKEGDKIFATSFGKGGENGGSANGIRVTFFDANGVAKSLAPADTYAEFTANGGYLIAPEGTIAVNIPMWTNSDAWEIYILNRAHIYESTVTAPTCTEKGYTTYTCNCGDSYVDDYVDALGHSMGDWYETVAPGCETEGEKRRDCAACDYHETQATAATGHGYKSVVTAPACTEQGYTTHTCTTCGHSYVDSYVSALGHSAVTDAALQPTSAKTGLTEGSHCGVCGTVLVAQEEIPARGYDWMLEDGVFKLLLIGNSFSEDASSCGQGMTESQLLDILQAMLGDDVEIVVGLAYSGGKGLNWHATQADQGKASHSLRIISSNGTWSSKGSMVLCDALEWTDWDMISLQHYGINVNTGEESVPYPEQTDEKFYKLEGASEYLLDYVDQYAPQADVYFYMHWARTSTIALNAAKSTYDTMAGFFPVVLEYAGTTSGNRFADLIPVGLSIQNARTTYLALLAYNTTAYSDGNLNLQTDAQIGLQRDGGHVSFNIGRYIAGLTFAEILIPEELRADGYELPSIRITESIGKLPDEYTQIAQASVLAAVESWKQGSLAVTEIAGYAEDPTVAAGQLLANTTAEISCAADAQDLSAKISEAVLSVLAEDFAVDAVSVSAGAAYGDNFTCDVTIRFGYTSLMVRVNCTVVSHAYESVVTAPTCTEQGYTTHTCTCGDSYVDSYVDMIDHSYGSWMVVDEDIRERVCSVCGNADRICRLMLPTNYTGFVYVENNLSGFYTGTRNVADILGLKSGTYTNGEVTIIIDGTNITVSGTPTTNLYFDLQTGTFGTPDYKRDVGYSLPDGDYRFGINGSGTRAPTVCIRYPDGSGNLMTASQGTGVHTVTGVSGEDFGVPYLYFPKDTAYDYSGNLVLTMGSNALYDAQVSQVDRIQGIGEFTVDGYLWSVDTDTAVFGYRTTIEDKKQQIVYIPGNKQYILVYLPQEEGYLQIRMNLANSVSTNAYGWRLDMMYACDENLNEIFPITQNGEYEAAIKLKGRSDFMGMGAHGSEQMTSFAVYVDGAETSLDQLTLLTQWETIKMVRTSDFYDPADETTVVAYHTVEYLFDRTGLTVNQDVQWLVDEICAISYMMMFPVRRTYENLQITDTYFDDFDSSVYDVSQPDFKTYPANWTAGATKLTLYSEKSGITASMESLQSSQLTGTGYKMCSNSSSYNKLYFTICGGGGTEQTVKAGDIWTTSTRYEVVIQEGTEVDSSCVKGHTVVVDAGVAPTCTATGLTEGKHCSVCGKVLAAQEVVAATGHTYKSVVTEPTCTEQGYTTHTCANCGDSYVDSYVNAKGHSYGNWIVVRDATCTEDGQERRDCADCDHYETRVIEATGHDYKAVVTEPTCTEQGYTTHTCTICGDEYVDSYVSAKGHSYGNWTVVEDATCTEDGQGRRDCAHCDYFETRTMEAAGHDYESVVTEPTCTEQGYTTHTCANCGDSYVDAYVAATGHNWGEWVVEKEPTAEESGEKQRTCERCGQMETESIPKLELIYGDVNRDGQVNVKDVVLLRQYLAGWNVTLDVDAADANGDGQVNVKDVVLLRQYLAGWNVTLGPSE